MTIDMMVVPLRFKSAIGQRRAIAKEPAEGFEPSTPALRTRQPIDVSITNKELTTQLKPVCTSVCTREAKNAKETAPSKSAFDAVDADLTALVNAWPTLPAMVRARILAMVRAASAAQ
jgi:hypothetical protein